MTGITKGPWTVERQGPSCATIWAGDQCVFDAIDVAGNEANLTAIGEVPAMVAALRDADQELQAWRKNFHPSEWPDKPVVHTAIRDKIRVILSRIDGATPIDEREPAENGPDGQCLHCGRDNRGHEGEPCADDCPQYHEAKGLAAPTDEPATPTGELVTVRADHLAALVEAAGKYADDLETGLEDGTYEDQADLDAVQAAIAAVQGEN